MPTAKPGPAAHRRTLDKEAREYQNYTADVEGGKKAYLDGLPYESCPHPHAWRKRRQTWFDSWSRTNDCASVAETEHRAMNIKRREAGLPPMDHPPVEATKPDQLFAEVQSESRLDRQPTYATLPMIRYEVHPERDADGAQMVDLWIAHISCTAYVFWDHIDETKRDLDNMKNAVAAAAKVAKILATARPQCAGDEFITVEFKRTDLTEIEKLLKVERK